MDPSLCTCHSGKCKAHLCQQRQRAYLRQYCPSAVNQKLKPLTKALTDSNGRFLNPEHKCQFPWGNYLMAQWIQPPACCRPTGNVCGFKHFPPTTKNLPRYFKSSPPTDQYQDYGSEAGDPNKNLSPQEQLINQAFSYIRNLNLPVIWVLGHAHCPAAPTRQQFCVDLAAATKFLYINLDFQVRHWTDQLFHQASAEEALFLPPAVKRLATMCVQLMGDDELHLNGAGVMEIIRLMMITSWEEAQKRGCPAKGFIIENFPVSKREAEAFEQQVYPASAGLYFEGRWWSDPGQKMVEPEVCMPKWFRRDTGYKEAEVEQVADGMGARAVKILNMEEFREYEAQVVIAQVKDILAKMPAPTGIYGGGMEGFGGDGRDNNYTNEAMRQLALMYKCQDPNCKCAWREGGGNEGETFGGVMGGGGAAAGDSAAVVIKCPLERPKKIEAPPEEKEVAKKEKVEAIPEDKQEVPKNPEYGEIAEEFITTSTEETLPSTPMEENTGSSTPPTTTLTSSTSDGGKKTEKSKGSKKGSKNTSKEGDKVPKAGKSKEKKSKDKKGKGGSPSSSSKGSKDKMKPESEASVTSSKGSKGTKMAKEGKKGSKNGKNSKESRDAKEKKKGKGSKTSPTKNSKEHKGSKSKESKGSKSKDLKPSKSKDLKGSKSQTSRTSPKSSKPKGKKAAKVESVTVMHATIHPPPEAILQQILNASINNNSFSSGYPTTPPRSQSVPPSTRRYSSLSPHHYLPTKQRDLSFQDKSKNIPRFNNVHVGLTPRCRRPLMDNNSLDNSSGTCSTTTTCDTCSTYQSPPCLDNASIQCNYGDY